MTIDLTDIIIALITLTFMYVSAFVEKNVKAKTSKEEQETMFNWARIFVSAAEEMHRTGLLKNGEEQFAKVMQWLGEKGYTFDTEASKAVINGFVWDLINSLKPDVISEEVGGTE